jgi:hypothetical protein
LTIFSLEKTSKLDFVSGGCKCKYCNHDFTIEDANDLSLHKFTWINNGVKYSDFMCDECLEQLGNDIFYA